MVGNLAHITYGIIVQNNLCVVHSHTNAKYYGLSHVILCVQSVQAIQLTILQPFSVTHKPILLMRRRTE